MLAYVHWCHMTCSEYGKRNVNRISSINLSLYMSKLNKKEKENTCVTLDRTRRIHWGFMFRYCNFDLLRANNDTNRPNVNCDTVSANQWWVVDVSFLIHVDDDRMRKGGGSVLIITFSRGKNESLREFVFSQEKWGYDSKHGNMVIKRCYIESDHFSLHKICIYDRYDRKFLLFNSINIPEGHRRIFLFKTMFLLSNSFSIVDTQ
jgi:hypothetical protein